MSFFFKLKQNNIILSGKAFCAKLAESSLDKQRKTTSSCKISSFVQTASQKENTITLFNLEGEWRCLKLPGLMFTATTGDKSFVQLQFQKTGMKESLSPPWQCNSVSV